MNRSNDSFYEEVVKCVLAFLVADNWVDSFKILAAAQRYLLTDEALAVLVLLINDAQSRQPGVIPILELHLRIIQSARAVGIQRTWDDFRVALQDVQITNEMRNLVQSSITSGRTNRSTVQRQLPSGGHSNNQSSSVRSSGSTSSLAVIAFLVSLGALSLHFLSPIGLYNATLLAGVGATILAIIALIQSVSARANNASAILATLAIVAGVATVALTYLHLRVV